MNKKIYIIQYNGNVEEGEIIQEFEYSYLCIFDNKETLIKKRKEQLKNLENFKINE